MRHVEIFREPFTEIVEDPDTVLGLRIVTQCHRQPFLIGGLVIAAFVGGDAGLEIGAGRHPRHEQDSHNQQANYGDHDWAIIAPSICRGERQIRKK